MKHKLILLVWAMSQFSGWRLPAQSFQAELGTSAGINWSWGMQAQGFVQEPYLTFSLQGSIGVLLGPHLGLAAGLSYFEAGTRTYYSLAHLGGPEYWSIETVNTYVCSPRIYVWYAWNEQPGWLGKTQVSLGLRYGRSGVDSDFPGSTMDFLPSGQTVTSTYLSRTKPHHAWLIEASYTYELLRRRGHSLAIGLHAMKGLSSIMFTDHDYAISPEGTSYQSRLTLQGDYLGLGVVYRWRSQTKA
jgi:hypothetical protein